MENQVFVVRDEFGRFMFATEDEDRAMEAWENGYEVSGNLLMFLIKTSGSMFTSEAKPL